MNDFAGRQSNDAIQLTGPSSPSSRRDRVDNGPARASVDDAPTDDPLVAHDAKIDDANAAIADELSPLLLETTGQIADVAKCVADGITDRKEMVASGAAANAGAVANIQSNMRAIVYGEIPTAPSLARLAKSAASSFLRQHRDRLSDGAILHLEQVVASAAAVAKDTSAQGVEAEKLQRKGDELEDTLEREGGVYVYTYPQYWWYPTAEGTERTLLKVGMTTKDAGDRVKNQANGTAVPEDPLLLRVYQSPNIDPQTLEKKFHRLLRAADHVRDGANARKEWFETSVGFLDTVAEELGLTVLHAEDPE